MLPGDRLVEAHLLRHHLADAAHALADVGFLEAGEVEPHRVGAAPVDVGGLAGDEGDVLAQRLRQQILRVDVLRQSRPHEQAPLGPGPGRLRREVTLERLQHRVPPASVDIDEAVDVGAPASLGEVLAHEVLGQGGGAEVGGLLAEHDLLHHRGRRHRPAQADARREDLGEGAQVEDVVAAFELIERREGVALVAEQAVGVVLGDQDLVLARQLDQAAAALEGERDPGRVLEAGHRVDELRTAALRGEPREGELELVEAHAFVVALDLDHVRLVAAEDRHRAGVGGGLADDRIAGIYQRLRDQIDRLLTAGGDDDVLGLGQHALRPHHLDDAVLGLLEALGGAVLERLRGRLLRDASHLRGEALGREGRGVGKTAGERDHLRPRRDRHQVAHRRGAHHPGALREKPRVALQIASGRMRAPPVRWLCVFHRA
jgi:hypothetical protein